jgi:hypothetical protein
MYEKYEPNCGSKFEEERVCQPNIVIFAEHP